MADKTVKYEVSAENQGYLKSMEEIAAASLAAEEVIKGAFGNVGAVFQSVFSHLGAITAVLAGGAVFGAGVAAAKELTGEATKLSKALGINTQDASILNVALKSIGSSADTYAEASEKIVRQVRTNEAAVNAMGVATRGANGQLLDGKQLMDNSLKTLASYREGTDRNLAGQQLFGKGAAEVRALLKLNNDVMEEARRKAEALGLVVGPEQAANVKAYKESMEGLHLVVDAIQNAIGQALIPILTQAANWFSEAGPAAVGVMREAIAVVVDVIKMVIDIVGQLWDTVREVFTYMSSLVSESTGVEIPGAMQIWRNAMDLVRFSALIMKTGIEVVFEGIRGAVLVLVAELRRFANVALAAFQLDWPGVKAAWKDGAAEVESILAESEKRILEKTAANAAAMQAILEGRSPPTPGAPAQQARPQGRSFVAVDGAGKIAKAQFDVIRAQMESELALQKEYLKEAQDAYDDAYRHNRITVEEFFAAKLAIEQKDLQGAIDIKRKEIDEIQRLESQPGLKQAQKLELKAQEIRLTGQLAVLTAQLANTEIKNARELNDELLKRTETMREIQRLSTRDAGSAQVDMDRVFLQQRLALKKINDAQYLQAERDLQQRLFELDLAYLQNKLANEELTVEKRADINRQIVSLQQKHAVEMAKIDKDIIVESQKFTLDAQQQIEDATTTFLASLGDRTKSIGEKFRDLATSIERSFEDLIAKQIGKQLFASLTENAGGGGTGAGWLGPMLSSLGSFIPSFDVGTPSVPRDTLAMVHKGERIVTASDNASGNYGGRSTSLIVNFALSGAVDTKTQDQVARRVMNAMRLATSRNG
jgi:hypothetical protein